MSQYEYFKFIFQEKQQVSKDEIDRVSNLAEVSPRISFPQSDIEKMMENGTEIKIEELLKYIKKREEKRFLLFNSLSSGHKKLNLVKLRKNLDKLDQDNESYLFIESLNKCNLNKMEFTQFCQYVQNMPLSRIEEIQVTWKNHITYPDIHPPKLRTDADDVRMYNPFVLLTAGAIAGAVSRTITAPLDRLKVLFQAGGTLGGEKIVSLTQTVKAIWKDSGILGFYRGNGTNIIKIAPETAIKFWVYENSKKFLSGKDQDIKNLTVIKRFLAGAIAGISAQTAIYPLEVAKTRLALAESGEYRGIADCLRRLVFTEGFMGLYKGLLPALTGIIPYAGVDLAVYSLLKDKYIKRRKQQPTSLSLLGFGVVSSISGQIVAYPLVVIRTRLQAQGMMNRPILYHGMIDCAKKIISNEGYSALYRGMLPNFMKAVPAISISYVVYEKARVWMLNNVNL